MIPIPTNPGKSAGVGTPVEGLGDGVGVGDWDGVVIMDGMAGGALLSSNESSKPTPAARPEGMIAPPSAAAGITGTDKV